MKLSELLKKCKTKFTCNNFRDLKILGVHTHSSQIKENYIFGAIQGKKFNGEKFVKKLTKLENLVIIIPEISKIKINFTKNKGFIIIKTGNVRKLISEISYFFYPSFLKEFIAITGTNGKTSIADYTRQIWNKKKIDCFSVGTLGIIHKNKKIYDSGLTTPESVVLNKKIYELCKKGCKNGVIEASSIGLHQNRLFPIKFDKLILTNFSIDHLDYHKTITEYKKSKGILFENHASKNTIAVLNSESKFIEYFTNICKRKKIRILDYGKKANFLKIHEIKKIKSKCELTIIIKKDKFKIILHCLSIFEIYNKICALLCVFGEKLKKSDFKYLAMLKNPSGRLEKVKNKKKLNIFIDYAHTPDALKNVLSSLKKNCEGKIITIIGCGGERDRTKRPLMTKEALKYSHKIIITNDNPRNESPAKIREDMLKKVNKQEKKRIIEIPNRKRAIENSIKILTEKDFLIIAGKGHENYQIIKNKKLFFSDKKTVLGFIKEI